jgi:hypothetical protein
MALISFQLDMFPKDMDLCSGLSGKRLFAMVLALSREDAWVNAAESSDDVGEGRRAGVAAPKAISDSPGVGGGGGGPMLAAGDLEAVLSFFYPLLGVLALLEEGLVFGDSEVLVAVLALAMAAADSLASLSLRRSVFHAAASSRDKVL